MLNHFAGSSESDWQATWLVWHETVPIAICILLPMSNKRYPPFFQAQPSVFSIQPPDTFYIRKQYPRRRSADCPRRHQSCRSRARPRSRIRWDSERAWEKHPRLPTQSAHAQAVQPVIRLECRGGNRGSDSRWFSYISRWTRFSLSERYGL